MSNVTYDKIKPLLTKEELQGTSMCCEFTCPVSGTKVDATGSVRVKKPEGMAAKAKQSFKRGLLYKVRRSVMSAVSGALGGGMLGRVGRDAAGGAMSKAQKKADAPKATDADKQEAVVDAFKCVLSKFAWDPENERWISAQTAGDSLTDFTKQSQGSPVAQKYDVGVMARMLIEIAGADGDVADEEKAMISALLPEGQPSVEELLGRPALSNVELEEVSEGSARETMLMFAWAIAMTDEELAAAEVAKLTAFAEGLGIVGEQADALKVKAQKHIVNGAIEAAYADGTLDADEQAELMSLATNIGLAEEDTQRLEIKYRKRMGIV